MRQEQFIKLLKREKETDRSSLDLLAGISREYPYCQPARVLLAKNLQHYDKADFERQVNQASAYATDRRIFQAFISDRPAAMAKNPAPELEPAEKQLEKRPAVVPATPMQEPAAEGKPPKSAGWTYWLMRYFGLKKSGNAAPPPAPPPKPVVLPVNEGLPRSPKAKVNAQLQIIDRFLQQEPRIVASKDRFSEVNLAEKSVAEHGDLVSETLAQVFEKQGKTKKAIDLYEKLSLKYPEKSSYFAKKISALKNETT
jgi:hypothetical protein